MALVLTSHAFASESSGPNRNNPNKAITISRGARVTLGGCQLSTKTSGLTGIILSDGSSLEMTNCEVSGFEIGMRAVITQSTKLSVTHCTITDSSEPLRIVEKETPAQSIHLDGNNFSIQAP